MKRLLKILECTGIVLLLFISIWLYIKFAAYVNKTNNYMIEKEREIIEKQIETYKEKICKPFTE